MAKRTVQRRQIFCGGKLWWHLLPNDDVHLFWQLNLLNLPRYHLDWKKKIVRSNKSDCFQSFHFPNFEQEGEMRTMEPVWIHSLMITGYGIGTTARQRRTIEKQSPIVKKNYYINNANFS
jgi:hypothetical protein